MEAKLKKITFMLNQRKLMPVEMTGEAFDYQGISLVVHGGRLSGYEVSEVTTGMYVSNLGLPKARAIQHAIERIDSVGVNRTKEAIQQNLKARNEQHA